MLQYGDICLHMPFAHAVRLRVASACFQHCSVWLLHNLVSFIFYKNKETVTQPQMWQPLLPVYVWTADYACESLLYDIGLKDLSLSYVQVLEVMKYFYSLISWMSTLAVKWIIRKSPFSKPEGCFSFLWSRMYCKYRSTIGNIMKETVLASKE